MHSLRLECTVEQSEFVSAELYDLETEGINEEDLPAGLVRLRAF